MAHGGLEGSLSPWSWGCHLTHLVQMCSPTRKLSESCHSGSYRGFLTLLTLLPASSHLPEVGGWGVCG